MKDAMEHIRRNASSISNVNGIDNMPSLFRSLSKSDQIDPR